MQILDALGADAYTSLHHDLTHGKRLELEAIHGHAVRLGERHGIPTPMLFAVYAALRPHRDGAPVLAGGTERAERGLLLAADGFRRSPLLY